MLAPPQCRPHPTLTADSTSARLTCIVPFRLTTALPHSRSPCVQGRKGSERLRASLQDTQTSQWGRGPSLQSHRALGGGGGQPSLIKHLPERPNPQGLQELPSTPPQTPPRPPPQPPPPPPLGSFRSCGTERNRPRNKQTGCQAPAQSW